MSTVQEKIDLMNAKKEKIMQGGGASRIAKQHEKGKLTARERIEMLFDEDTFVELDQFMKHAHCRGHVIDHAFGRLNEEIAGFRDFQRHCLGARRAIEHDQIEFVGSPEGLVGIGVDIDGDVRLTTRRNAALRPLEGALLFLIEIGDVDAQILRGANQRNRP